jgi:hypothetical protein
LDGLEEGAGGGGQVAGEALLAVAVEDGQEQAPGVQVDAGIESGVGGVKKRGKASGSGWCEGRRLGASSIFAGESLQEYPDVAADRGRHSGLPRGSGLSGGTGG